VAINPIEVPSFGFDENVGMSSQGDSFSAALTAATAGAALGDVAAGASAANIEDGTSIIAEQNKDRIIDRIGILTTPVSLQISISPAFHSGHVRSRGLLSAFTDLEYCYYSSLS
jgi:hypothetical protein